MHRFLPLTFFLCSAVAAPASADVVVLPCTRDNTLFADANGDTSNGAGPAIFAGRNGQGRTMRGLMAFDLAGALPPGARVDSVVLSLVVTSLGDSSAVTLSLHRMSRAWGEGTSSSSGGTGAPATPGDATWLHAFYPADPWVVPGGDFDPPESATQTCADLGPCTWSGPGLVADVTAWLSQPKSNHGWLLRGGETGLRTVRRFGSREAAQPVNRPILTVHFSPPQPVDVVPLSWGKLKSSYR